MDCPARESQPNGNTTKAGLQMSMDPGDILRDIYWSQKMQAYIWLHTEIFQPSFFLGVGVAEQYSVINNVYLVQWLSANIMQYLQLLLQNN
jgi:hypothetical protein